MSAMSQPRLALGGKPRPHIACTAMFTGRLFHVVMTLVVFANGAASRASPDPVAPIWASFAVADVEALNADIAALHPGMRDPRNPDFAASVARAHVEALAHARAARSFLDWRDATSGFMLSFRDGHTIFRPTVAPSRLRWPGFLIDGQGGRYVVRAAAGRPLDATMPPAGARLVSCDGVPVDLALEKRLDRREADWSKAPERIRQAWRFFVDYRTEGDPPAKTCTFETATGRRDIALEWRVDRWSDIAGSLAPFLREPIVRHPNALNFRPDGAAWVSIGSFGDEATLEALRVTLAAAQVKLRAAPYVVFDLRGNGGGNSTWGGIYAAILWGDGAVAAAGSTSSGKFWRASPAAARQATATGDRFAAEGEAMSGPATYFRQIGALIAKHPGGDKTLMPDPSYSDEVPPPPANPAKLYAGKVYVLSDAGCFSSCVVAMQTLRRLGAVQVGEPSGQNEEYGEVAGPLTTPSGLARYFVPLTIIRQQRADLGGLPVDIAWPGAMDGDAGIAAWIAGFAKP